LYVTLISSIGKPKTCWNAATLPGMDARFT